jgi:hypothetical protein
MFYVDSGKYIGFKTGDRDVIYMNYYVNILVTN